MATQTFDFMNDTFKQATQNFARTLEVGIKFQEDAARFWTDAFGKNAEELRTQWEKLAADVAPFSKKNMERFHKLFEEQSARSLELLKKSLEANRASTPTDALDNLLGLWRNSFDTIRESADAVAKANADLFESWTHMAKGETNGHKTTKGRK